MTINLYQELAGRAINKNLNRDEQYKHALYGMAKEIGELYNLHLAAYPFQERQFEPSLAKKEIGNLLWLITEYCIASGWKLEDICETNIDKLMARYPDKFMNSSPGGACD